MQVLFQRVSPNMDAVLACTRGLCPKAVLHRTILKKYHAAVQDAAYCIIAFGFRYDASRVVSLCFKVWSYWTRRGTWDNCIGPATGQAGN